MFLSGLGELLVGEFCLIQLGLTFGRKLPHFFGIWAELLCSPSQSWGLQGAEGKKFLLCSLSPSCSSWDLDFAAVAL